MISISISISIVNFALLDAVHEVAPYSKIAFNQDPDTSAEAARRWLARIFPGGNEMIDHFGLGVADYERAKAFYTAALAPLGYALMMEATAAQTGGAAAAGYGRNGKADFWIGAEGRTTPAAHFAITADNRAAVDAFHVAALAAGGVDNGAPGLRPHYHPDYYAAFVRDLDGHNLEAVCHAVQ